MRELASLIDHTLLRPDAGARDVDRLCAEAREHGFAAVCVNGAWVEHCARALAGSRVAVCSVIGFPLGAMAGVAKAFEARTAVAAGAREVDVVMAVGPFLAGDLDFVARDIERVVEPVHASGGRVKVILETARLTSEQVVEACRLAQAAGADFVKTSTGFGPGGATPEVVALMRRTVGPHMGVKASGGVRDRATALAMLEAGATRIGTSSSLAIVAPAR